jgi:hypothetical protein
VSYVSVQHEPDVWVDAHVEKQWKHEDRWRLSVYYFVGQLQYYREYDTDQVRPVSSTELQDDETRHAPDGQQRGGEYHRCEPINLRDSSAATAQASDRAGNLFRQAI